MLVDDVLFTGRTIRAALERAERLRPGPGRAAGRHGRPRPPGAAHPARTSWARTCPPGARRWSTWVTRASGSGPWRTGDPAPAPPLGRRPRRRRHRRGPPGGRVLRRGRAALRAQGPHPAGQGGGHALLRGVDPHPPLLRDGGQAALGRRALARRGQLVGQEGRVAARHGRDRRGDGHRRPDHPPLLVRRTAPGGPLGHAGPGHQRRRRLARAPHPGAPRLLHGAPGPGRAQGAPPRGPGHRLLRGTAGAHRGRHPPQPGGPLRGPGLQRAGGHGHLGRARQPAAALARGMAGDGGARLRRRPGRCRCRLPAAAPGRAGERLVRSQPARVHRRLGPHRPPGGAACARTPS